MGAEGGVSGILRLRLRLLLLLRAVGVVAGKVVVVAKAVDLRGAAVVRVKVLAVRAAVVAEVVDGS